MRADRLLSLLLLLHAKGRMTAEDLAAHLEVSERTIYRDISALGMAGIPICTQAGTNGGVFLDENYRLSLTGLTRSEIQALFVGAEVGPLADLGLAQASEATLFKLFAALPAMHRQEVEQLRQRFYIDPINWFHVAEAPSIFPLIQRAVWEDRQVEVTYQPVEGERTACTLDALALVAKANIWYLVGRKTSGELRNYRISRFGDFRLTDAHFQRDPAFDLAAYWKASNQNFERTMYEQYPPYPALILVAPEAFRHFPSYMGGRYQQIGEPGADGWIMLRVLFTSLDEARMRVLGLGAHVRVIEPPALHQTVIETAQAIVAFHTDLQPATSSI